MQTKLHAPGDFPRAYVIAQRRYAEMNPEGGSGAAYAVTSSTQPSGPTQTCTVSNGSGNATANVTNVAVKCVTGAFTVGGKVTGLSGTGLVLQNNDTDNLTISADGAFTFATQLASGMAYAVTILTQPAGQICSVTSGSGAVGAAVVDDVALEGAQGAPAHGEMERVADGHGHGDGKAGAEAAGVVEAAQLG